VILTFSIYGKHVANHTPEDVEFHEENIAFSHNS